jgi:hypothetical protein
VAVAFALKKEKKLKQEEKETTTDDELILRHNTDPVTSHPIRDLAELSST